MDTVQSSAVTAEQLADADVQFEKALKLRDSDLETAVQLLGQVLEIRNKAYGENSLECADTYLYYGQCLFEQAQASSDFFGDQMKSAANQRAKAIAAAQASTDGPETQAADAAEGSKQAEASATGAAHAEAPAEPIPAAAPTQEPGAAASPAAGSDTPAKPDTEIEDAAADDEAAAADEDAGASGSDGDGSSSSDEDDEGGDDDEAADMEEDRAETAGVEPSTATGDTDDMALAWEMLELARLIYNNNGAADTHANKLADCHLYIGDILAEQEKFEAAVEEYKTAQDMLARVEGGHTGHRRRAAELDFKKATALQLLDAPAEALAAMEQAKAHLTAHLQTVNAQIKQSGSSGADVAGAVASAAFASILSAYASSAPSSDAAAAAAGADAGRDEVAKLHQEASDLQGTIDSILDRIEELSSAVQEHISMKEQLANIFKAVAAGGGDSSTQQGAAGSSEGVVETIGFGAAGSSQPAGEVKDIGVIGRGKRVAPTPAQPVAAAAGEAAAEGGRAVTDQAAAATVTGEGSRKRPLSDLSSSDQEAAEAGSMADNGAAKVAAASTGRDAEQLDAAPKRPCL